LKHHGGVAKEDLNKEDLNKLEKGLPNLLRHIDNMTNRFGLPTVVAINKFYTDTDAEIKLIREKCMEYGVAVTLSEVWEKGGDGGVELANEVIRLCDVPNKFDFLYTNELSITQKIEAIAKKIYGADGVDFLPPAVSEMKKLDSRGLGYLPVCMAKTQYSFSDNPVKLGAPQNFRVTVRNIKASTGAGFVVAYLGDIMTMPGLPKVPSAENIDVDATGKITGLF
jgi:formate--tetrahydrofolate ligase